MLILQGHEISFPKLNCQDALQHVSQQQNTSNELAENSPKKIPCYPRNSLAGTLSGGQKRRLSAAIALIGGSQVVP